ncbi:hypothetical protein MLD38_012268 [Melastoma candidum]|uniref:Uncharacterized protein n=1 Tax=Melastoma candidum TaxID=119954 RepID=A0ACB9R8T8_9MYRT|nr:hypothetical protein MLD38_012268 [Melastoma candidum]
MDAMQMVIPVVGIVAAAAITFYAVSFSELREKSFQDLEDYDESENAGGSYKFSASSREKRARRKAAQDGKPRR